MGGERGRSLSLGVLRCGLDERLARSRERVQGADIHSNLMSSRAVSRVARNHN